MKTNLSLKAKCGLSLLIGLGLSLWWVSLAQAQCPNRRCHVDTDVMSSTIDGMSWTTAYPNLQDALAVAQDRDEIWVAEGVYYPDEGGGQTDDDVMASFAMKSGVKIYGGFAGTETWRGRRQPRVNVTVLSGDIDRNDVTDSDGVVTTTANITGSNARHVIFNSDVNSTAVLDGFTITAGDVNVGGVCPGDNNCGGGMYNIRSSPEINQISFRGNRAGAHGGGMVNWDNSNPEMSQISFSGNSATLHGGGMINSHSSHPEMSQVSFSGNFAAVGGGMFNQENSNPKMSQVSFSGNAAQNEGGGMFNTGSNPHIVNSIFWANAANGLINAPAQIANTNGSSPIISYTLIQSSGGSSAWDNDLGSNGGNNLDADPLFQVPIDPADAPTSAGNLRLRPGSPAIDAGDYTAASGSEDLEGAVRIQGVAVDLGAYEVPVSRQLLYVDADATSPTPNGLSWTTAYPTLPAALNAKVPAGDEIWVAEGIYYPDEGGLWSNGDRNARFSLKNGVEIYGGFAGTETERSQRQPRVNVTVLSGDIDENDNTDSNGVVTTTDNIIGDNAYHVFINGSINSTAVLDGFTITAGNAEAGPVAQAGGGMYNTTSSSPQLTQISFSGNSAAFFGGGMYNSNNSHPEMSQVSFSGNQANSGGGMYNTSGSNPQLTQVSFSGNSAQNDGGGMYNSNNSHPEMSQVSFSGNQANSGGGMYNTSGSNPQLTQVSFSGNSAANSGGGMFNSNSDPHISNSIFWGNAASGQMNAPAQIHNLNTASIPVISYTLIQSSGGSSAWDNNLGSNGGNNLDADPLFLAPIDPADAPTSAGNLRLQTSCSSLSPAIDVGDDSAARGPQDLEGAPRIQGAGVDLGAYESRPTGCSRTSLSKVVSPTLVEPDQRVTYTLLLINSGTGTDSVRLTDTLPSGVEFAAWGEQRGAVMTASEISWQGPVTAGENITITFGVSNRILSGTITNTAQFSGSLQTGATSVSHTIVNVPPIGVDDIYTTTEDTTLTVAAPGVLSNDSDPNGDSLKAFFNPYSSQNKGNLASTIQRLDGNFIYTPNADANGLDYIGYFVSDGMLRDPDLVVVTITIEAVNDGPVAIDDTASTNEDEAVSISVLSNDTDVDDINLSLAAVSLAQNGRTSISGQQVVYSPSVNFAGMDRFTYRVSDGMLNDTALVTVTVNAVNDAPVAAAGADQSVRVSQRVSLDGSRSSDVEGDALRYSWQQVSGVNVTLNTPNLSRTTFIAPTVPTILIFHLRVTDEHGLVSRADEVFITVTDEAIAGLSAQNSSPIAAQETVTFTANILGGTNVRYAWEFGDGVRDVGQEVTHVYTKGGMYTATVEASNSSNSLTATTRVRVTDEAIAGLRAQNSSPAAFGEVITFTANIRAGENVNYTWQFGDGDRGVGQEVTHFYIQTGTYTASVKASNSTNSLTATTGVRVTNITGTGRSVVTITGLTVQNSSPAAPKEVITFTADIRAGDNVNYRWDFGDGFGTLGQEVSHVYTEAGRYTATVLAINSINSLTATTGVTVTDEAIAGLSVQNSSPTEVNEVIIFTANITAGTNVSYTWHFGDGGRAGGQRVSHVYTQAGRYTATVVVSNSTNTLTATTGVRVTDEAIEGLSVQNSSPAAAKEVITFTAHITAGENVSYTWHFGDGGRAVGQEVSHVYTQAGRYTATVVVSNSTNRLTAMTRVTVTDEAIAGLRVQNSSPAALNEVITFTANITAGERVNYTWDFGEGGRAVGQEVTYLYRQTGTYTASVKASNSTNRLTATTGVTITDITERSVVTIAGLRVQNSSPTEVKEVITFTAHITAGDGVNYRWDFGDGFSTVGQTVTHFYTQAGRYTATVLAINSINTLTATTGVTVTEAIAGLRAQNSSPTEVQEVITFTANITAGTNVSYTWHFGDGGRAAGQIVSHVYTEAGRYIATVVVSNSVNTLTATTRVTVTEEAIEGLRAQNSSPAALNEVITFTAHITAGERVNYTWHFGDGGSTVGQEVTYLYLQTGTYTASVLASNSTNRLTATTGVTITDITDTSAITIAGLTVQNSSPAAPKEVITFTANITAGDNVNYRWDFGDGFSAVGQSVSHAYPQTGTYTATVLALNSINRLTATTGVTVTEAIAGLSVQNSSPAALNEVITFTANITAGDNVTYTWDFGDGGRAVGRIVSHVYIQAGRYIARVVVSNSINTLTATTEVTVTDEAIAGLRAQNSSPAAVKEVITFTAHITAGTNVSYIWHFGDGGRAVGRIVNHVYTQAGRYTARVVVNNSINTLTATTGVTVTEEAIAGLSVQNSPVTLNEVVTFTANIAAGTNVSYTWDFGDGGSAMGQEVTHVYNQVGTYTARVEASNSTNTLTATTVVSIIPIEIPEIDVSDYLNPDLRLENFTAYQGVVYSYTVRVSPSLLRAQTLRLPATQVYMLSALQKPAWLDFVDHRNNTGTLMGMPGAADQGESEVTILATDGQISSTAVFTIAVGPNQVYLPLVLGVPGAANRGESEVTILATDGQVSSTAVFTIAVGPNQVYLPLVLK